MKTILYYIVTILIVLLSGCSEEQAITPSGKAVKIGVIGPMSGPKQALGEESLEGIQTALHMHPYLDNGDTIKLIIEDDKNEPEQAVKAFKKLVSIDKVAAVLVLSSSASALAINDIADKHKIPVMILVGSHPEISKDRQFVSQICFDNTTQGKVAALFARDELLIDRVAVFKNPESFHSNSLAEEFIRKFRSIEGQITDVILIPSGKTVEYESILSHLRDQDVEFLYLPLDAEDILEVAQKLHEMGWAPEAMTGDGLLSSIDAHPQAKYLNGFLTIDLFSSTIEATSYGKKATRIFKELFETRHSTYPAIGFEGMAILIGATNRCQNSVESECINNNLHNTVNFEGLMGKISIQPDGKALRPLIVNRIQNERLEFVVKVY